MSRVLSCMIIIHQICYVIGYAYPYPSQYQSTYRGTSTDAGIFEVFGQLSGFLCKFFNDILFKLICSLSCNRRNVWRYHRDNQRKDRQYKSKRKGQTTIYKRLDYKQNRTTRTPLKIGGERRCSGRVGSSAPLVTPVVLLLLQTRW